MPDSRGSTKTGILSIIRGVRARWRLRMVVRGASIVLAAGFAAFLLSAVGLEAARFSPAAVVTLRLGAWIVVLATAGYFLFLPLLRRVSDERVALYLEEREPSLEAAILGAMAAEKQAGAPDRSPSPALLGLLVERAVEKARAVEFGKRIERRGLLRGTGVLAFLLLSALLFFLLGPAGLRYGMSALVLPTTEAAEVSPYAISVLPGDVTLARGADQLVTAELRGFDSDGVSLFFRTGEGETHRQLSMIPADSGRYELLLLNLLEETEYFVEANGVRSPTFTMEVADLPYVERMAHTYVFPSHTGLEPRVVEEAGDIAALAGTLVRFSIGSTIPTPGGRLVVNDSVTVDLVLDGEGGLYGELLIRAGGVYRVELAREGGRMVPASPEYTIDVLRDLGPSVAISRPGRDASASAVEEIFVEARADDDYGIERLLLVYSVNGRAEDSVSLFRASGPPLEEVSAGHTLFLEEWELDPGDVVSYYAVARDSRDGRGEEAMSDIYFVNIRPFRRDFRQAEQQQQGGQPPAGAMGQQGSNGSLSELQREVVAATFNLLRDREAHSPVEFSENTVSVALAQERVRDEVANLLVQMTTRGVSGSDPHFQEIAGLLPEAVADMEAAEASLRAEDPREALAPEQRALTVLQKAEETYERFVGQQQQGGGGGGGGGASADELADLFELELDRLQNQYETVQRGERQQADEEVDALMERLKELARRQQQELERQRARADAGQGGQGGSAGESQRSLADEAEEAARELAELSRRTGDQELAETARRLQEAAESMRRSATGSGQDRGLADATSALDEMEEAQRRLDRAQDDRMEEGIQDALDRVERLARAEEEVRERVEQMPENPFERGEDVGPIHERKDRMAQEALALERELVRMRQRAQSESREAASELGEAVEAIREGRLKEKLAYTKGVVEERERAFALEWEEQIAGDIETLRRELEEAARAYGAGSPDRALEEALEEARALIRGTESLGRRLQGGAGGQPPEGTPPGGGTRGGTEPFSQEEVRQLTREFGQRLAQTGELRDRLQESGREIPEVEEAMEAMEALRDPGTYGDLPQVALLQEQIRENLRSLEFRLRREVEGDGPGRGALSGSGEVPTGFRRMVDEYFRNLARRGGGG